MEKKTEAQIIEELLKSDKLKIIKPNECGLLFDEKRERIIAICNKDGKPEIQITEIAPKKKINRRESV